MVVKIKAINVKQTAAIKILIATKIKGDKLSRAIETLMKEAPQIAERMINNIQLIKPGLWIVGFNIWLPMTDTASDALLNV